MAKFTMAFLYVSGSLLFLICVLGLIASFIVPGISFAQAFAGMILSASIMGIGAIIQVLREIASNTANQRGHE